MSYDSLVARVLQGGTNEEILEWCFSVGRQLSDEDITIWSDFLRKRGWRDSSEVLADLEESKKQSGLAQATTRES